MTVGKPNFDLNSFGVKYLSKDQVQDFLEINKFGKNIGDTPDPVEETTDKDGNVIQKKPHPQKGEVFTDIKGLNPHQNPKPVKRGGFKNRQMRRVVNGKKVKVGQTEEETTPPEGQVPTSRLNDVQFGKLGEESTDQVRESFDYHTNSPKWQEAINRDAELTTEQGTAKFDDTPANRALRDKIAAREHKKKLAAEKKKKLKKANDIIMDMNIMKLDLMKDAKDGKGSNKPVFGSDDIPFTDSFAGDRSDTNVMNYLETYGGDDEPTGTTLDKLQEVDGDGKAAYLNAPNMTKKQPIKPKLAKSAAETIFKAISLKLDLTKTLK